MDNIAVTVLLAFVSILLTINLYILRGIREDFKALWEKIDNMIEKNQHTVERLIRAEAEIEGCIKRWDRGHREE